MLENTTIAFIGGGVMGEAMIKGLLAQNLIAPEQVVISEPIEARRQQLHSQYGVHITASNGEAARQADILVLSIKPQALAKATAEMNGKVRPKILALSIIAGVPISVLRESLTHSCIVRSMPNTPAQVGKGITVWTATPEVSTRQRAQAEAILGALGEQLVVEDEAYLDMATALSGSGPGFVFLLIEAMIDAGVHIGFSRADAQKMVLQTIDGSVELVRATGLHPAELRNRVTSPGGTTAAGLYELENGNVRAALDRAIFAAYRRSQELGRSSDKRENK